MLNITQIAGLSNTTLPVLLDCNDNEDAKLPGLQWSSWCPQCYSASLLIKLFVDNKIELP